MLTIRVPDAEFFDEETQRFVVCKGRTLSLEHSLVSLSKWEAKWKKPFLSSKSKTSEEILDYIRCMTITQNVSENVYQTIKCQSAIVDQILKYIEDPMTATTINENSTKVSKSIITSEIIYYWMIQLGIPVEFQKWHLNRLLTLIKVCDIKTAPKKKMPKGKIHSRNRQLNALRRSQMNSAG